MTSTRRVFISLVALLTLASAALPASAGPPDGRGRQPKADLVDVTITLVGDEGVATTCPDTDGIAGSLRMERTGSALTSVEGVAPLLELHMREVVWSRAYPAPASGLEFAECHGGPVAGSPIEWEGYLSFDLDSAGFPTGVTWHFDYYVENTIVRKGKKTQQRPGIREHFTLSGPLTWNPTTSTATGMLEVSYYFNDYVNGVEVLYEPFEGSPRLMAFSMTIESAD